MKYTEDAIIKRKERVSKIKSFFKKVVYIMLIPLLIYNISLIVQAAIKPNETPAFFGIKMYVIVSGSMEPEISIGDIVIVKDLKNESKIEKDNVISFRQGQTVITHRVIELVNIDGKEKYKTKGDNNNTEDTMLITREQVEGIVINKISSLGNIILKLRNVTSIIIIALFYYVFLVLDSKKQNRKALRRIKREKYEEQKKEEEIGER